MCVLECLIPRLYSIGLEREVSGLVTKPNLLFHVSVLVYAGDNLSMVDIHLPPYLRE